MKYISLEGPNDHKKLSTVDHRSSDNKKWNEQYKHYNNCLWFKCYLFNIRYKTKVFLTNTVSRNIVQLVI